MSVRRLPFSKQLHSISEVQAIEPLPFGENGVCKLQLKSAAGAA